MRPVRGRRDLRALEEPPRGPLPAGVPVERDQQGGVPQRPRRQAAGAGRGPLRLQVSLGCCASDFQVATPPTGGGEGRG